MDKAKATVRKTARKPGGKAEAPKQAYPPEGIPVRGEEFKGGLVYAQGYSSRLVTLRLPVMGLRVYSFNAQGGLDLIPHPAQLITQEEIVLWAYKELARRCLVEKGYIKPEDRPELRPIYPEDGEEG